jgi:quinoprotein glucose dehydrogenase
MAEDSRARSSLVGLSLSRRGAGGVGMVYGLDPDGYPAIAPPWGTLNAIDLKTGQYLWKIPFGEYPELAKQGMKNTGTENYGGPIVTAGGLLFIGATVYDRKFHAFDTGTGTLLWEYELPFAGMATPSTYMIDGRQYVVTVSSGGPRSQIACGRRVYGLRVAALVGLCKTGNAYLQDR